MRQDLSRGILEQFAEQAQSNGSALAIGISQYTPDGNGYENAVINLSEYHNSTSDVIPYYAKNHLVPFGEYKPLPAITERLYKMMDMPLADFQKGGDNQAPLVMKDQKVAFNICYEDGFGDELIATAKRSTLLANISNMAWYGKSNAMYQQLQQSQARAMELGRYMVRATNTGATAIISPKGTIVAEAQPDQKPSSRPRQRLYRRNALYESRRLNMAYQHFGRYRRIPYPDWPEETRIKNFKTLLYKVFFITKTIYIQKCL